MEKYWLPLGRATAASTSASAEGTLHSGDRPCAVAPAEAHLLPPHPIPTKTVGAGALFHRRAFQMETLA